MRNADGDFSNVFFSPAVQAETYRISGKATYADNSPVSLDYVYVECEKLNMIVINIVQKSDD